MAVNTAAGSRLFIGPVPAATVDSASEFAALTPYVEVGEIEDLGEFGDEAGNATFTALADRRVRKLKTSFDAGTMSVICGSDPADLGQIAMRSALASDLNYSFKVVLSDEITSGGTPTTLYFKGLVMSKRRNVGNVENVVKQSFTVGINSDMYETLAT